MEKLTYKGCYFAGTEFCPYGGLRNYNCPMIGDCQTFEENKEILSKKTASSMRPYFK